MILWKHLHEWADQNISIPLQEYNSTVLEASQSDWHNFQTIKRTLEMSSLNQPLLTVISLPLLNRRSMAESKQKLPLRMQFEIQEFPNGPQIDQ